MAKNYCISTGNGSAIVITKINRRVGEITFINYQQQQLTLPLTSELYQFICRAGEGHYYEENIGFNCVKFSCRKGGSILLGRKFITTVEVIGQGGFYYKGEIHDYAYYARELNKIMDKFDGSAFGMLYYN